MFTKDLSVEDVTHTDPALITGADFYFEKGTIWREVSFKELYFKPYISDLREGSVDISVSVCT